MITPVLMLVLMTAPFLIALARAALGGRDFDRRGAAAMGLAALFVFTGIGHFVQTESMVQMLPPWVPMRLLLVYVTGIGEFAIALGFLIPRYRSRAGWAAAAVLIAFFPANIYAAINQVPMGGHAWGVVYLWIRTPVQIAILTWVVWFTLMPPQRSGRV